MNTTKIATGIIGGAILLFSACKSATTPEEEQVVKECIYSYNEENSVLEFTAFKFANRTGVGGSFNDFSVNGLSESDNAKELVQSLGFVIDANTVETNDPDRNKKIATYFFGMINTQNISGRVVELKDNGKAALDIKMNDTTNTVVGDYTLDGVHFSFNATIDVNNWNAMEGINTLNDHCIENHTGTDGVIKLWSEVDIKFTTKLDKTCSDQ